MPAQIYITKEQIAQMAELGEDLVVLEGPLMSLPAAHSPEMGLNTEHLPPPEPGNTLEVWVMDERSTSTDTHRSVVLNPDGDTLGDARLSDDQ